MENFLNSYAFEQMTKEYNKKYGYNQSVEVLNKKEDERLMLKVKTTFDKVFHLFYLLYCRFGLEVRFKKFFSLAEHLKNDIKDFYINTYNIKYIEEKNENKQIKNNKSINHKECVNEIMDIYICFFDILKEYQEGFCFCKKGLDLPFFEGLIYVFSKFTKIFKTFYLEI